MLAESKLRFVCDRGFDDEKTFAFVVCLGEEFVIRLYHNRTFAVFKRYGKVDNLLRLLDGL